MGYFHQAYCIYLDRHLSKCESGHISCKIRYQTPLTFYRSNTRKSFFSFPPILDHLFSNPFSYAFLFTSITHLTSSLKVLYLSHFLYLLIPLFSLYNCFSNPDTLSYVSLFTLSFYQSFDCLQISFPDISLLPFPATILHFLFISLVYSLCSISFTVQLPGAHEKAYSQTHTQISSMILPILVSLLSLSLSFLNPNLVQWKDKQTYTEVSTYHNNVPPNWLCLDGILSLWKGVSDSGLMRDVLSSLQTELLATLKGVEVRSKKANLQETGETPVKKNWFD